MYPKVKVKVQEDELGTEYDFDRYSSSTLKDFQSFSSSDSLFSEGDFPDFVARIPKTYVPIITTPKDAEYAKGTEKRGTPIEKKEKPNIRATPVLRPRAVISSPDNDAMIGHINRKKNERPSGLKNIERLQTRHAAFIDHGHEDKGRTRGGETQAGAQEDGIKAKATVRKCHVEHGVGSRPLRSKNGSSKKDVTASNIRQGNVMAARRKHPRGG